MSTHQMLFCDRSMLFTLLQKGLKDISEEVCEMVLKKY